MIHIDKNLVFLLVGSFLLYSLLAFIAPIMWDSAVYLLYAKSMLGKTIFIDLGTPPFIPKLIATVWQFTGESEIIAKFLSIGFSVLAIVATYFLGKKLFNERVGLLAALFLLTNPLFVFYTPKIYTDIPLALFMMVSLYFFYVGTVKNKPVHLLLSGALIGISVWIKYPALLLYFITFLFVLISERKSLENPYLWIAYFFSFLIILPNFGRLAGGSVWVAKAIPLYEKLLNPYYYFVFPLVLFGATLLIFLLIIRKRFDLLQPKYVILILTIILVFSFYQNIINLVGKNPRYLIPAIPPAVILASKELDDIIKKKKWQKLQKFVIIYFLSVLTISLLLVSVDGYRQSTSLIKAGEFLKNNVDEDSLVISNFWPEISYYSEKTTKWFPSTPQNLHKQLQTYKIDYVVLVEQKESYISFFNAKPDPEWATIRNIDQLDFLEKVVQYEDNGKITAIYKFTEDIKNRITIESKDNYSFSQLQYN